MAKGVVERAIDGRFAQQLMIRQGYRPGRMQRSRSTRRFVWLLVGMAVIMAGLTAWR